MKILTEMKKFRYVVIIINVSSIIDEQFEQIYKKLE